MKFLPVVIVTILFMALLMTSDAGKGKGKCKTRLKIAEQQVEQLKTELQEVGELKNELQKENAEIKKELEECKKPVPTVPPVPPECQNYQTLSTGDRKNTYTSATTVGNRVGCDNNLGPAWFRFQGAAGTKMATSCVQPNRCGTHAPGWLNGAHPTVNEGKVTRKACFTYFGNCCIWSINIQVRNCGDFYVYYINKTPPQHPCHLRYCGSD